MVVFCRASHAEDRGSNPYLGSSVRSGLELQKRRFKHLSPSQYFKWAKLVSCDVWCRVGPLPPEYLTESETLRTKRTEIGIKKKNFDDLNEIPE
jgi:hypothetical protein